MIQAWLLLALASPLPNGERSYRVLVDGQEDGAASLSIHARPDGSLDYRWRSQIGVSRDPCLWSEEQRGGNYREATGRALPDELALSLLPADARGEVDATINGQRIHTVAGRDGLPNRVDLPALGLSYVQASPDELRWNRCGAGSLEHGPALLGADPLREPRRVRRATFAREAPGGWRVEASVPETPLPADVQRLVAASYARSEGRDCKIVAEELARQLERAGLHARVVAGWIVERGALWPHAWTEVDEGSGFHALDATTSRGWADAARIRLGTLGDAAQDAETGGRLLSERHARVRLVSYVLAP
jgi:hypothetical protein